MKILLVGENINTVLLAKYINVQNPEHDIYITSMDMEHNEFCTPIDIKESDIPSLLDFVKYNQIEFTIVLSQIPIINGIADEFQKEKFLIFAPTVQSARATYFNSIAKKLMYKLKIPTPRFGIFDKEAVALDYVRGAKFPLSITNDFVLVERISETYNTFSQARLGIQKFFENGADKIVIENYIDAPDVYMYFLSDGYNALPLISVEKEVIKDGEVYISKQISENKLVKIMQVVVYPLLDDIAKFSQPYVGIVGLKAKLFKNSLYIYEFYDLFQNYDLQLFLSLLDENLFELLYDCAIGELTESRDFVSLANKNAFTLSFDRNKLRNYSDLSEDIYVCEDTNRMVCTATSSTLNLAKERAFDYVSEVADNEFCKRIKEEILEKELRV